MMNKDQTEQKIEASWEKTKMSCGIGTAHDGKMTEFDYPKMAHAT